MNNHEYEYVLCGSMNHTQNIKNIIVIITAVIQLITQNMEQEAIE